MMRNYLRRSADRLNYVTVHYYKSASRPGQPGNDTVETLLQETDVITKWIRPQVAGIDFHQGSYRYAKYECLPKPRADAEDYPLDLNYRVQPSFYGMLFFQMANLDQSEISQLSIARL